MQFTSNQRALHLSYFLYFNFLIQLRNAKKRSQTWRAKFPWLNSQFSPEFCTSGTQPSVGTTLRSSGGNKVTTGLSRSVENNRSPPPSSQCCQRIAPHTESTQCPNKKPSVAGHHIDQQSNITSSPQPGEPSDDTAGRRGQKHLLCVLQLERPQREVIPHTPKPRHQRCYCTNDWIICLSPVLLRALWLLHSRAARNNSVSASAWRWRTLRWWRLNFYNKIQMFRTQNQNQLTALGVLNKHFTNSCGWFTILVVVKMLNTV